MSDPVATEIRLRRASRVLEVSFSDGSRFELPFEYLRVHSPSAEVKGHGPGQEVLVLGKENVGIRAVEPVGQYAVKLVFDDGHDTGLYTWKYLHELAANARPSGRATWSAGRALATRAATHSVPNKSGPDTSMPGPLRAQDPLNGGDSAHRAGQNATTIAPLTERAMPDRIECVHLA